jgi:hypothetical protein
VCEFHCEDLGDGFEFSLLRLFERSGINGRDIELKVDERTNL